MKKSKNCVDSQRKIVYNRKKESFDSGSDEKGYINKRFVETVLLSMNSQEDKHMGMTIGQNIRQLRKEREMTQDELAAEIGVTPQAISKWENDTGLPDIRR